MTADLSRGSAEGVPAGFELLASSAFVGRIGPIWESSSDPPTVGVVVDATHCNSMGTAHGGLIATLADVTLGRLLKRDPGVPMPLVTAELNVRYLAPAKTGQWLEGRPLGAPAVRGETISAACELLAGDTVVAEATAVYTRPRSPQATTG